MSTTPVSQSGEGSASASDAMQDAMEEQMIAVISNAILLPEIIEQAKEEMSESGEQGDDGVEA